MSGEEGAREFWRRYPRTRPDHVPVAGAGQESVWDYPRPPRVEASAARVRVRFAGVTIAQSAEALRVLETAGAPVYYLPRREVGVSRLCRARDAATSLCEWKGVAEYWDLRVGPRYFPRVAWSYPEPDPDYEALRDHIAFFAGRGGEAWVGNERVVPQPGGFYGGWITPNIVGPFKGEPGTEGW